MHLQETTLLYSMSHKIEPSTLFIMLPMFGATTSNSLGGDAFTRKKNII